MGDSELDVEPRGRLSIYSDQGYIHNLPLAMTRWIFHGPSQEVVDDIQPGMARENVVRLLGELESIAAVCGKRRVRVSPRQYPATLTAGAGEMANTNRCYSSRFGAMCSTSWNW